MHKFDPSLSADKTKIENLYNKFVSQVELLKTERDNLKTAWNDPNDSNRNSIITALDSYISELDTKTPLLRTETDNNIASLSKALQDLSAGSGEE